MLQPLATVFYHDKYFPTISGTKVLEESRARNPGTMNQTNVRSDLAGTRCETTDQGNHHCFLGGLTCQVKWGGSAE